MTKYREVTTVCSKCHEEPRLPGQRYGRKCKTAAQGSYRQRKKDEFLALVADRAKLVAMQIERMNSAHDAAEC